MKNKKGFTLIELLAVIVILAVIALIAVPIILNMIENSKKGAAIDSAYGFVQSVEYSNSMSSLGSSKYEKIEDGTDLDAIEVLEKIKLKGTPPTSGTLSIEKGRVISADLCIYNYNVNYDGLKAKISGKCGENGEKIEEDEPIIPDKKECELEAETIDSKEYLYIDSVEDMYAFSKSVNNDGKSYEGQTVVLRNSLDFTKYNDRTDVCGNGVAFEPIGTSSNSFKGTFDGNNKTIKNLIINNEGSDNQGIFGYIDGATIKNLQINNINILGKENVGSLIGYSSGSSISGISITNINVRSSNSSNYSGIGGVIGYVHNNTNMKDIFIDTVNVESKACAGGIIGYTGNYITADSVLARNINVKGDRNINGVSNGSPIKNIIVENMNVEGTTSSAYTMNSDDKTYVLSYKLTKNKGSENEEVLNYISLGIGEINYYESLGLDTYIGGDNNDNGYYFDYENDTSNKVVLKSILNKTLPFTLEGKGTDEEPYIIDSTKKWKEATIKPESHFKITKDLDFKDYHFYMMGSESNKFTGSIDGEFNKINNITLGGLNASNIGIFGYIDRATVKNLKINNINVLGNQDVGSLIGKSYYGSISGISITNINVKSSNSNNYSSVGGVVGYANGINMKDIFIDTVNVESKACAGGIVGYTLNYITADSVLARNINVKGDRNINGVSNGSPIKNIIVENMNVEGTTSSAYTMNSDDKTYVLSYKLTKNKGSENEEVLTKSPDGIGNISYYESLGLDTYIGGDTDNSGYYFDYENNTSNKIVLKNINKNPISFTLLGSGTKDSPYIIDSTKKWKEATSKLDKYYKVTTNLDFNNEHFYMMGSINNQFTGNLIGDMNEIKNIEIGGLNAKNIGIFGYCDSGKIDKISFKNIKVTGVSDVGGIIGNANGCYLTTSKINTINVNAPNSVNYSSIGGVIGYVHNYATIDELEIDNVTVNAKAYGGGVIGYISGRISSKNILGRNIKVYGERNLNGICNDKSIDNIIIENMNVEGTTDSAVYSNITNNSTYVLKYDVIRNKGSENEQVIKKDISENIGNLSYYTNKIETIFNGDKNNTGYYFGLDSNNKISLIKAVKNTNSGGSSGSSGSSGTSEFCENYSCTCDCGCESCGQQNVEFACKSACGLN